jgi:hypothetical protein
MKPLSGLSCVTDNASAAVRVHGVAVIHGCAWHTHLLSPTLWVALLEWAPLTMTTALVTSGDSPAVQRETGCKLSHASAYQQSSMLHMNTYRTETCRRRGQHVLLGSATVLLQEHALALQL